MSDSDIDEESLNSHLRYDLVAEVFNYSANHFLKLTVGLPFTWGIIYVNKQVLILTAFVSSLQVRTLNLLNLNMLRLDSCADGR